MDSAMQSHQAQRLLQIGVALILYSSIEGFAIPFVNSPRLGLSVHTLSGLQGIFLLAQGLLWTRLRLGLTGLRIAFVCSIYSSFAILAAYTIAAVWGVGIDTIALSGELPHGLSRGSEFQEAVIKFAAYSSAPTGLTCFVLMFWGLRTQTPAASSH